MKRNKRLAVLIASLAFLSGCSASGASSEVSTSGGTSVSSPSATIPADGVDRSKKIEFSGQQYTCGQALQRPDEVCETDVQNAFNKWGDNLVAFANDPLLSAEWGSNVITFENLGVAGLGACAFREANNAFGFTQYMKQFQDGRFGSNEAAVATLYGVAGSSLCPGV